MGLAGMRMRRREFLKRAVGVAAGVAAPYVIRASAMGAGGAVSASNRLTIAVIGVGGMGTGHVRQLVGYPDVKVAAVCDIWPIRRQKAKRIVDNAYGNNDCAAYTDFRELLARKDIDGCVIATCDHWHVLVALEAARRGKDMYLQKSMGVHFDENQILRKEVKRTGVVFQFGTQQRSDDNMRFVCELVRNERIGKLHTIMVGSIPSWHVAESKPEPIPAGFDYDLWLGPAPWSPYSFMRCGPRAEGAGGWYVNSDYAMGHISGWGIHHVDIAQWGNGSDDTTPIEVEGTGVIPTGELTDTAVEWEVEHKYANGVKLIHLDYKTSRERALQFQHNYGCAILFIGTDGWVLVGREGTWAEPAFILKSAIGPNEIRLPRRTDHMRDFLDCMKTRAQTMCPIDVAVHSDTICHQGNIALRLGRKLRWDPVKERFINDDEANRMLTRSMRSPWRLENG
jgi:predicted dehydrogenase